MKRVFVVVPGGTEAFGGMSRFAKYFESEWKRRYPQSPAKILDTYGPGPKWQMPFYFASSLLRFLAAGALGHISVAHINMAERLSIYRKLCFVSVARALGVPVVLHLHAAEFVALYPTSSGLLKWCSKRVFGYANEVIVLGVEVQEFLISDLGVMPEKITVVWNGVPPNARNTDRAESASTPVILFLGALNERKGMPELLKALSALYEQNLPFRAILAGNGDKEKYQALAEQDGVISVVTFPGWVDMAGARKLMTEADIFVLPSHNEGLPLAILEAMASGLPVVATPVGSVAVAVNTGLNGILVPPGDVTELTSALATLLSQPDTAARMGEESAKIYDKEFSVSAMTNKIEAVFSRAIAGA